MEKILVFDMDGTIADLYGVNGWLDDIIAENERPYAIANPIYDMLEIKMILTRLKKYGWKIGITSWLAKNSTDDYNKKVIKAKTEWLDKYNFPYDILNIVKYGTQKTLCTKSFGGYQILVDDEKPNRDSWNLGLAINPDHLLDDLFDLLISEVDSLGI